MNDLSKPTLPNLQPIYSENIIIQCIYKIYNFPKPLIDMIWCYFDDQVDFIRGRKVQLILDRWSPNGRLESGRAAKMLQLLPELISTETKINSNVDKILTLSRSKFNNKMRKQKGTKMNKEIIRADLRDCNVISSCPLHHQQQSSSSEQFELGKDWQFLLDTNHKKYSNNSLSEFNIKEIRETARRLRQRVVNGYHKYEDILNKIDIIHCRGSRCRVEYKDGYGIHCEDCYPELSLDDIRRDPNPNPNPNRQREIKYIQCNGSKCRIHKNDNRGLHCSSCFGDDESDDDDN